MSSTLTTVVVFAPLGLLSGVPGQFFRALSLSLSVAVLLSLVWSISLVPVMGQWAARRTPPAHAGDGRLDRVYGRLLGRASPARAGRRVAVLLAAGTALLAGRSAPASCRRRTRAASSSTTRRRPAARSPKPIDRCGRWSGSSPPARGRRLVAPHRIRAGPVRDRAEHAATSWFGWCRAAAPPAIVRGDHRRPARPLPRRRAAGRHRVRAAAAGHPRRSRGQPRADRSEDLRRRSGRLAEMAEPVEAMLEHIDGVVDVVGTQAGGPDMTWTVDPGRGRALRPDGGAGLARSWPATGSARSPLRCACRIAPCRCASACPMPSASTPTQMATTVLRTADGAAVPLSAVATMTRSTGEGELRRENLRPVAVVSARLEERDLGSAVDEIRTGLARLPLPIGYTYEIGGQAAEPAAAFRQLLLVFALAGFLVFAILVAQFRAWLPGAADPAGGAAVVRRRLVLLWLTGIDLNISSAMGFILLVGLTVKNGIMLLDAFEVRRAAGEPFADGAGPRRPRPAPADPDDDGLHAVRAAAAGARARRRRRVAAAAGRDGDRRPGALDPGDAAARARAVCRRPGRPSDPSPGAAPDPGRPGCSAATACRLSRGCPGGCRARMDTRAAFSLLGVSPGASPDAIRDAYRDLVEGLAPGPFHGRCAAPGEGLGADA